ncbi:altronate dehydratase family protein [Aquamicrobium sp. LC103]|uniref:UxaA family hydrolase n=1 Tax=Aquamicrobium sp. LC103 TaxID=1120658 RepID=UPI00063E86EC|nr:altronate dehydratase family protein [Aquamicrobium sp. LC103]TKT74646.1 altronate dehydratase [Aquamicrobium sp. LC103]
MLDRTPRFVRLHAQDNVVICVDRAAAGARVGDVAATETVPRGHKMATQPIAAGAPVRKFGQIIGFASADITAGAHVHEHNCAIADFERDYAFATENNWLAPEIAGLPASFNGFRRANGRVGTRNYIAVLTSVNCSASVARFVAKAATENGMLDDYPNVDGVVAFTHGTGCGMDGRGEGYDLLQRTVWGHAASPNVGGALMIGLGCEVFQIPRLLETYGLKDTPTFRTMTIQQSGGTRATVERALETIREMLPLVDAARREEAPISELSLALQCGGSDGYSGITANPALGFAADLLVAMGGTAILSETPEIYGAEHLLTRRAVDPETGEKLVRLIRWWEAYTARLGGNMNNNPSPGNKLGGLTTILEKSLGAAAKAGTSPLAGVFGYGEPIDRRGFVFMDSPGYDPCSATGQVASGANLIAFTTGRGSAFGYKPVPSVKLATNSELYANMAEDMDLNCGDILDGISIEEKGREIFRLLVETASGRRSKSEELGYGDNEFVPWQIGAVM